MASLRSRGDPSENGGRLKFKSELFKDGRTDGTLPFSQLVLQQVFDRNRRIIRLKDRVSAEDNLTPMLFRLEHYLQQQRRRQEISGNALEAGGSSEKNKEEGESRRARKVVVVKLKKPGAKDEEE